MSIARQDTVTLGGKQYKTDDWFNVPKSILSLIERRLHVQPDNPLAITRRLVESKFPGYRFHNDLFPVVTVGQNFDSLGFPVDHVGRNKSDTYYINRDTVLRTHTSAHQVDTFGANLSDGFLISADVYRRDAVDRSHYPVFHQMEGAETWDRSQHQDIVAVINESLARLPPHDIEVEDPNPSSHPERNPVQSKHHSPEEVEAIAAHLKRSLENVFAEIFTRAKAAAVAAGVDAPSQEEPLKMRWVEAYFPFTSPSWELEVFWQGDWLEVLGCGVVKQDLLIAAGVPNRIGWAFGIGLERIAMVLFGIPDIRLFWSTDERFLSQFRSLESSSDSLPNITRFVPFSRHPPCYKDVSFWVPSKTSLDIDTGSDSGGSVARSDPAEADSNDAFHENDLMELVRDVASADCVESVTLLDSFTHPRTGRSSLAYRIIYRAFDRTLTNDEANTIHERVRTALVERLGVELR